MTNPEIIDPAGLVFNSLKTNEIEVKGAVASFSNEEVVISLDLQPTVTHIEEYYGSEGEYREFVRTTSQEGVLLANRVKTVFSIDIPTYLNSKSIGIEVKEDVITCRCPGQVIEELYGEERPVGWITGTTKFLMKEEQVAIKAYRLEGSFSTNLPEIPEGSNVIAISNYVEFPGFAFPEKFKDSVDVFFLNDDHEAVCAFFNKDFKKGDKKTGYSVRMNQVTGVLEKVKAYIYNDTASSTSQWEAAVEMAKLKWKGKGYNF